MIKKAMLMLLCLTLIVGCNNSETFNGNCDFEEYDSPIMNEQKGESHILAWEENTQDAIGSCKDVEYYHFEQLFCYLRILYSCGMIPIDRIDYIDEIIEYNQERINHISFYRFNCYSKNRLYMLCCILDTETNMLVLDSVLYNNTPLYMRGSMRRDYIRVNNVETRKESERLLQSECNFSISDAKMIMGELDILFDTQVVDFYDIKTIDQCTVDKKGMIITITSIFGQHVIIKIYMENLPIIINITQDDGETIYECQGDD